ncbi:MAG: acyltransferase [Oligoflexia bacterium]|nr:acyltransferase [Oligoflexia bacterium]
MLEYLVRPQNILILIPAVFILLIPFFRRRYFISIIGQNSQNSQSAPNSKMQKVSTKVQSERFFFYDFLKGIGILAVVAIHITYVYKDELSYYNTENIYYYINNISNNILRFTIPFFLLISGILLKPFNMQWKWKEVYDFYVKKFLRLIPPYILCVLVIHWDKPAEEILNLGITGKAEVPFYFMLVLFQCYFFYPVLMYLRKYASVTIYILLIISMISAIFPVFWDIDDFPLFLKYIFFFAYGAYSREYFLNYNNEKVRGKDFWIWVGLLGYYLIYILLSSHYYYNTRFFFGLALFHLVFYYQDVILKVKLFNKFFAFIGKFSLWIFLTHYQVLLYFQKYFERPDIDFYLQQIYTFIATFIVTILISFILDVAYNKLANVLSKITATKC